MKRTQLSRRPSKAKRDFDAEYAAVLPSVLARGCEFEKYGFRVDMDLTLEEWECGGRDLGHHAKGRRAKDANAPENLRCLCDKHHRYVHANGRWSREVGLMLSRVAP